MQKALLETAFSVDSRRFAPSSGNSSIWRAQETAKNRNKEPKHSQNTAEKCRLGSVPLLAEKYVSFSKMLCLFLQSRRFESKDKPRQTPLCLRMFPKESKESLRRPGQRAQNRSKTSQEPREPKRHTNLTISLRPPTEVPNARQ